MKFAYYLVFALWYLLSLLPLRVLYFFSDLLFIPLYYGFRYRGKIVRKNLVESFPDKDLKEIKAIERKFYHFFCDYVVEVIKMFSISQKEMKRRMVFTNLDEVRAELEKNDKKFCFLYLGHY